MRIYDPYRPFIRQPRSVRRMNAAQSAALYLYELVVMAVVLGVFIWAIQP